MDAISLHSGEYVEHFKGLSTVRVERLIHRMELSGKLLDCGCGTGLMQKFVPENVEYHGVDFSQDFIDAAKELHPDGNFHCADLVEFCAAHPAEFDVATTFDFSEHIDDQTFRSIYTAIGKALKPSGVLYFHTPNAQFFLEALKEAGVLRQFPEHIAVRTPERNVALLRECGFSNVRCRTISHYNVLKHLHFLSRVPFVGRWFAARIWIEARLR